MNWETFYLVCFLAGLMLSFISLLGGMGHFGGHVHVPHVHVPHGAHLPHMHSGTAGATHAAGAGSGNTGARGGGQVPWWNTFSIMIFLCWFGAAGFLLTKYGSFVAGVVVLLAAMCGVAGGAIIFTFLTRVLMPHERELTAFDTDVIGVVGRVSSPIRAGGTGAIVYQQLGATRSANARSEDGGQIAKDEEVYVIRYERGIAYVRKWEEVPLTASEGVKGQGVGSRE